jgi:hypothetical protein
MKKIIFNIVLVSALLAVVSCKKDIKPYEGAPQIAFDFYAADSEAFPLINTPQIYNGTLGTIENITYSVDPIIQGSDVLNIDFPVTLMLASGAQGDISYTISVMNSTLPNDTLFAHSTMIDSTNGALSFDASGTISAGKYASTFKISVDYNKLSNIPENNVIFLELSATGSAMVAEAYRRIKLTFVKIVAPNIEIVGSWHGSGESPYDGLLEWDAEITAPNSGLRPMSNFSGEGWPIIINTDGDGDCYIESNVYVGEYFDESVNQFFAQIVSAGTLRFSSGRIYLDVSSDGTTFRLARLEDHPTYGPGAPAIVMGAMDGSTYLGAMQTIIDPVFTKNGSSPAKNVSDITWVPSKKSNKATFVLDKGVKKKRK